MTLQISTYLEGLSPVATIVISIAIMLFGGFLATRVTKLFRLPNVTAYILVGVALGPCCINAIPKNIIVGTDFISDIALAFIAFSSGEFFKLDILLRNGMKLVIITIFESLIASLFVFILTFCILDLSLPFSIILAALASATAPASTMMTIRQTNASGDYVDTLLSVVALDDIVSLIAFSVAVSISLAFMGDVVNSQIIMKPIMLNLLMIVAGGAGGCIMKFMVANRRSVDNRLIISVAALLALCGIGAALGVSPLLACMTMGMVYTNLAEDDALFRQVNYFAPPILLLFFVRSGLQFRLDTLLHIDSALAGKPLLLIGVLYFFVRILGKYAGAWLGCLATGKSNKVRNYLGLALIPQAGVAIGLAALGARTIGGETGGILQTIIMSSSILYELVGPACAKLGLYLSCSYGSRKSGEEQEEDELGRMKEELSAIQSKISQRLAEGQSKVIPNEPDTENDEYYSIMEYMQRRGRNWKMR
ncbi:MAG: cation:proton antiporter [Victivallales bacterium]|nr:cation:proton antiporter [Victivallales bacterium]